MSFLSPIAALLAAAVVLPALLVLYFLKLRRREVPVSSTLLWRKAVQDLQVNAPFQKLRKNLLLLLQLLLLLALLLALARPTWKALGEHGQRMVIVIDRSASMNATDVSPTRLEQAKEWARQKVDEYEGQGGIMIVSLAQQARVVQPFTNDRSLLHSAIDAITPTDQIGQLMPALRLIEPYALTGSSGPEGHGVGPDGGGVDIMVASDGRFADEANLALRGGKLTFVRIGAQGPEHPIDNLGIVAFSARRDYTDPRKVQVFARLENFGDQAVKTRVLLSVDGRVRSVLPVEVPGAGEENPASKSSTGLGPGGSASMAEEGAPGAGVKTVQFELTVTGSALLSLASEHQDQLAVDNTAWLMLAPPRLLRVLLVTDGNAFLEKVIESVGVRQLTTMYPAKYENQDRDHLRRQAAGSNSLGGAEEGYDLVVFDRYTPRQAPPLNSLSFGSAPPWPGLARKDSAAGDPRTQVMLSWKRDDPLLRYVALDDVLMAEPGRLIVPREAVVLATAQGGPVLAEVSGDGNHHVAASFPLLQTNWPMQVSFAVFMSNCLEVLGMEGAGTAGIAWQPGEVVTAVTGADVKEVLYHGPVDLRAPAQGGRTVLPMLEKVGLYEAAAAGTPAPWDRLAVNLADETESDLRPAEQLQVGTIVTKAAGRAATVRREVWPWFAAGALALLMIEWWVYTRRMHL